MNGRELTILCSGPAPASSVREASPELVPHEVHAWFAPLRHFAEEELVSWEALLDGEERSRAARFRFERDRIRYVAGHAWLRMILGQYVRLAPEAVRFARGAHGKPYVPGHAIRFNFSDTKDGILVAVSRDMELGADVETMQRTVDHEAVSEHYFTPEEIANIKQATDPKRRFLEFWTRKEAVLKASGVGIMDDLKVLRVDADRQVLTVRHPEFLRMAHEAYHVSTWTLGADHIVSLATPTPPVRAIFLEVPF